MRVVLTGLVAALVAGFALASPAEAGWKWKKMRWEAKPGQEFRSPYAHPGHGSPYGYRPGYGAPYGSYGGSGYGRPFGSGSPSSGWGGYGAAGPRPGW